MKILTIVENLGLGGTERVAQNFSIGYQQANCDTKVLATKALGMRATYLAEKNIEVLPGGESLQQSIEKINRWKPDVIHIHRPGYYNELNRLLPLIKLSDTKVIETNIFARPDYSSSANLIDAHLHLSNWSLWKWQKWTGNLNQLGAVVPNLIDCSQIKTVTKGIRHPRLAHLPTGAIILGRIGQPIIAKWNGIIFDALQALLKKDEKYHLALVGLPEILKEKLKSYPQQVQDHVHLLDPIYNDQELNMLYQSFDIFLHASQIGESFGMVLAEAHLNEIPIVTLNTPLKDNTQNELVGNGRGGFVVTDLTNMIKAIELIANNLNLAEQFGKAGAAHIRENFELGFVTGKALVLCEVLSKNYSRQQTLQALHTHQIVTHCNDQRIRELCNNMMGELSLKEKILLKLIHMPLFYRNYLKAKGINS
ncbi:MAG: glycosyltransferase family 4 protein [Pedobacter sp.]|nr:glycosyltransferase family 4 protein [Pedobacter sp.]MDQ8053942.1 glycosyltransferase family 4 protein [Pedobacter sp.]